MRALAALLLAGAIVLFYLKYVPLVPAFQALLLPFLLASAFFAAYKPRLGALLFVFLLPLVNNWPYFFGIRETVPHAPTALVLFLFYFLGVAIRWAFRREPRGKLSPLSGPLSLTAGIVIVSALITAWRFTDFFPIRADCFYEFVTNVNGVTAGGALMSTVFSALNYVAGFAFFLALRKVLKSDADRDSLLTALGAGLLIAIFFGFVQRFLDPALGNTAFWVKMQQTNATFKDPNAFGAGLAMLSPLFLGAFFSFRGALKWLFGAVFALGLIIYPFIGARSALLGLFIALVWFAVFAVRSRKEAVLAGAALIALLAALAGVGVLTHARLVDRLTSSLKGITSKGGLVNLAPERYFLWKGAASIATDYPFTGVGVGAYIIELPNYYTRDTTVYPGGFEGYRRNDSAEDFFFQIAAEQGLLGLTAFLWLGGMLFWEVRRGFRQIDGGSASPAPTISSFPSSHGDNSPAHSATSRPSRSVLTSTGRSHGNRLLFVGGTAGLLAYGVNVLFHTYIGSFETKFIFWFVAAVTLYASGRFRDWEAGPGSGKTCIPVWKTAAIAAVLLIFGGIHLWNSTHSLSPETRTREYNLNRAFGLYAEEKTDDGRPYHWTREYGGLPVVAEGAVIRIAMQASHPDIESNPVKAEFYLVKDRITNRIKLGEIMLRKNAWATHEFALPAAAKGDNVLFVKVSRTWNPLKTTGVPDPRNLGIALGEVSFR